MSKSEFAADATRPASGSTSKRSEVESNGVVSATMQEEEKKMKSASAKEEEERIRKTQAELQDGDGLNGTAVDERFVKLDRLLSQSKVGLFQCAFVSSQTRMLGPAVWSVREAG